MTRKAKPGPPRMRDWSRRFFHGARSSWLPANDQGARDALSVAGALVALVGDADDRAAGECFNAICTLLYAPGRSKHWRQALQHVPPDRDAVLGLADLIQRYEEMAGAGHFQSLTRAAGVNLSTVVPVMVRVLPHRRAFMREVRDEWFEHPNRVFSDEALDGLSARLRGAFGEGHERSTDDHARQVEENVRVVGGGR